MKDFIICICMSLHSLNFLWYFYMKEIGLFSAQCKNVCEKNSTSKGKLFCQAQSIYLIHSVPKELPIYSFLDLHVICETCITTINFWKSKKVLNFKQSSWHNFLQSLFVFKMNAQFETFSRISNKFAFNWYKIVSNFKIERNFLSIFH